jgi:hypothetical protein
MSHKTERTGGCFFVWVVGFRVTYSLGRENPEGQYGEIGSCSRLHWIREEACDKLDGEGTLPEDYLFEADAGKRVKVLKLLFPTVKLRGL